MKNHPLRLVLFFSSGMSLESWDRLGIFERECALYQILQSRSINITFVTYGGPSDLSYSKRLPGIQTLCNRWGFSSSVYRKLIPLLHANYLARADVIKTHQISGADIALKSAKLFHKKLLARCGYLVSENKAFSYGENSIEAKGFRKLEKELFTYARQVEVTTETIKTTIQKKYYIPANKVSVIPNYVETSIFYDNPDNQISNRICFIGRLDQGKNVGSLIEAIRGLDLELLIIGEGSQKQELIEKSRQFGVKVEFIDKVENHNLPGLLNSSSLFILPSLIEGHPKVLIEAMACGLPVIASDIPGNKEIITHKENGYLCGTSVPEIRKAIIEVMSDPHTRLSMGIQARQYCLSHFSLPLVSKLEEDLIHRIIFTN